MRVMARWQVELRGEKADLELLVTLFKSADDEIVRDGDSILLESIELESLAHSSDVYRVAKDIVTRINGAARLQQRNFQNVTIGSVHEQKADGTKATNVFIEAATIEVRPVVFPATIIGGAPSEPVASPASRFAKAAARDRDAQEALDLWAYEPHNWVNLYKVYEIIRARSGLGASGISTNELSRFTHTANHEKGGGRGARHARRGTDPPKDPMSEREADDLVGRLLEPWLLSL